MGTISIGDTGRAQFLSTPVTRSVIAATVHSQGGGWTTNYTHQHKVFYAAGRYWVFYGDGNLLRQVYRSSVDGKTSWSAETAVRNTTSFGAGLGHRIGYWCDGTYIHYAACDAGDGEDIFYRRGLLETNGTITWSAAEQLVANVGASNACGYPTCIVDSTGVPWVGIMFAGTSWNPPKSARVYKATTADGTWTTAGGFPFDLNTASSNNASHNTPIGVPLLGGKTFWTYIQDPGVENTAKVLKGRLWNGAAWATEETVSDFTSQFTIMSAAAEGDVVHLQSSGLLNGVGGVWYKRRSAGGVWGTSVFTQGSIGNGLAPGVNAASHTTMSLVGDNHVRLWYGGNNNKLYCRDIKDEKPFGSIIEIADETVDGRTASDISLNAIVDARGRNPLFVYTTKASTPFSIIGLLIDSHRAKV